MLNLLKLKLASSKKETSGSPDKGRVAAASVNTEYPPNVQLGSFMDPDTEKRA